MSDTRPEYKTPELVTYRDSEILKQMPVKGVGTIFSPAPENFRDSGYDRLGMRDRRYRSLFYSPSEDE